MKQLSEWVSTEEEYPPAEGWYLVRFETNELATRIAMHYRPKRGRWFVESNTNHDWKGLQPKYWLSLV
tara:strand:- start:2009 stop:2212 length:204 start_codon:yes stop_codon:yes gene_type:complete